MIFDLIERNAVHWTFVPPPAIMTVGKGQLYAGIQRKRLVRAAFHKKMKIKLALHSIGSPLAFSIAQDIYE